LPEAERGPVQGRVPRARQGRSHTIRLPLQRREGIPG
jgi:hypothetical protein